jgi:hypothetical protein
MPEPELKVAPVPVVEVSEPLPSEASAASVSAAPAPTRPKVTVTAPDTSAEITQDLDVSFLLTLADPPAVDEAPAHDQGMLSVPGEFTAQEPVSPVLDWFDEGSDSFELQDLSDIPDMPSPVPSTGTLPDQLSEQADVDPNAEVGNTTISTTASWSEGDMSFTDDILAAEMARCLDLNGNRGL